MKTDRNQGFNGARGMKSRRCSSSIQKIEVINISWWKGRATRSIYVISPTPRFVYLHTAIHDKHLFICICIELELRLRMKICIRCYSKEFTTYRDTGRKGTERKRAPIYVKIHIYKMNSLVIIRDVFDIETPTFHRENGAIIIAHQLKSLTTTATRLGF